MRILLDHNTPVPLRHWLVGHQVATACENGWAELTNGELLRVAEEAGFDAMITTDKGIRYQQNLAGRTPEEAAGYLVSEIDLASGTQAEIALAPSWLSRLPLLPLRITIRTQSPSP